VTEQTTLTVPVVSQSRQPAGEIQVPARLLAGPVKEYLLHESVKSQLASRRAGTVATKTRGFVSGGGKKPWKQKGTGRARAGSSRSPLWAGGAIIFGPQPRDWTTRLPRSARKAALRSALAARHGEGKLTIVDALTLAEAKTKRMVEALAGLGIAGSALIVLSGTDEVVERAARNLPTVRVCTTEALTPYEILRHAHLVVTRDALHLLAARLGGEVA
jgi:large subunit ribosomal protein L4